MSSLSNPFADSCAASGPFTSSPIPPLSSWSLPPISLTTSTAPRSRPSHPHRSSALSASPTAAAALPPLLPLHFQAAPRLLAQQFLPALRGLRDGGGDEHDGGVSEVRVHQLVSAAVSAAHQQWLSTAEAQRQHSEAEFERKVGLWMEEVQERLHSLQRYAEVQQKRVHEVEEELQLHRREHSRLDGRIADLTAAATDNRCPCSRSPSSSTTTASCALASIIPPVSLFSDLSLCADGGTRAVERSANQPPASSPQSTVFPSARPVTGLLQPQLLTRSVPTSPLPPPPPPALRSPPLSQASSDVSLSASLPSNSFSASSRARAVAAAEEALLALQRALVTETNEAERAQLQLKADALQRLLRRAERRRRTKIHRKGTDSSNSLRCKDGTLRAQHSEGEASGEGGEEKVVEVVGRASQAPPPLRRTPLRGSMKRKAEAVEGQSAEQQRKAQPSSASAVPRHSELEFGGGVEK